MHCSIYYNVQSDILQLIVNSVFTFLNKHTNIILCTQLIFERHNKTHSWSLLLSQPIRQRFSSCAHSRVLLNRIQSWPLSIVSPFPLLKSRIFPIATGISPGTISREHCKTQHVWSFSQHQNKQERNYVSVVSILSSVCSSFKYNLTRVIDFFHRKCSISIVHFIAVCQRFQRNRLLSRPKFKHDQRLYNTPYKLQEIAVVNS